MPKIKKTQLTRWLTAAKRLREAKEKEMKLRRTLVDIIADGQTKPGTYNFKHSELGTFSAVLKNNYKIDNTELDLIIKELGEAELKAFKSEPKLILKEYKKLPATAKLHRAVTEKEATPALNHKPPN